MCIIHKWKYDSKSCRTCIKCNEHQKYLGDFGKWIYTDCYGYRQRSESDGEFERGVAIGKKISEDFKKKCKYHKN